MSRELKDIKLHIFSDWHIGDRSCDVQAIKNQISAVKDTENAYIVCNGDLMNNATKTSVSDCYAEDLAPMEQINYLTELLTPVKDKILLITQGNHESRTYRTEGIDLTSFVASNLGVLDKYCREGGVMFLRFGETSRGRKETNDRSKIRKVCYSIYSTHGSGGGRKEGAKAIRLADMASIVDCDIYIHSHTHLPMIMKQSYFRTDVHNSMILQIEKLFVNTSSQLEYGGYGQTFEFKPNSKSNPVIYLSGTKKEFIARL